MTERVEVAFEGEPAAGSGWAVRRGALTEGLNEPYGMRVTIATDAAGPDPMKLLGKPAKITITRAGAMRQVLGIVSELVERAVDRDELTAMVELTIRPALEALRHRVNTKIFQDKTVPEILEEVLGEGLGAYSRTVDVRTSRTYPTCEYRVQYDESDLAFCQRLMEEEGIVYWFEHDGEAEVLVLADAKSAYGTIEADDGSSPIDVIDRGESHTGKETIHELAARSLMHPTKLATRHFDWTHPSQPIEGESSDGPIGDLPSGAHLDPPREIYEHDDAKLTLSQYAGTAYGANDVTDQVRLRREAQAAMARSADGRSNVTAMRPGAIVEVQGPRLLPGRDGPQLVVRVAHAFDGEQRTYENTFRCIPADVPYRPRRTRVRPRIRSVETATVVGPSGEEIHTDVHGRIKVQFHWDRLGAMDEHSSCWIRVMQPWAGAGWGFVFLPRIGMEVVVRFVDGDPDRPLVIGSVYNADHPLPYTLPDEKTKSTIKTESSLGGGGYNEFRFEDKAGSEEIFIHAQKDFNEVVENDHTTTVHHDQKIRVDNNQTQEIGVDQTEHVFANQDLTVDANRTVTVHGNYEETVDGSETRTVSSGVTENIDAGETRTITGGMTETISGGRTQTINGGSTETINGSLTQTVVGGVKITTPATYDITAAGGVTIIAPAGVTIVAPAGHTIVAPGGQTIIDGKWGKSGAEWYDNIAAKMSAQLVSLKWKAVAITAYGLGFEWSTFKIAKKGIDKKIYAGYFDKVATIKRRMAALENQVAAAHVDAPGA